MVIKFGVNKSENGFTFSELLIVTAILGILITLVTPDAYSIVENYKLRSSAQRIISDLRRAQYHAVTRETNVQIYFRNTKSSLPNTYSIKIKNGFRYEGLKTTELSEGIEIIEALFGTDPYFVFSTYGNPNKNGHVVLKNRMGQLLFVVVFETGRFRITEIEP